jgi:hypothetical protein
MSFTNGGSSLYDYEHQKWGLTMVVSEELNLAMTAGMDQKLVLHELTSRKTIKVISMEICIFFYLFKVGKFIVLGDGDSVQFHDFVDQKGLKVGQLKTRGIWINCMHLGKFKAKRNTVKEDFFLFVGGHDSNYLTCFKLPKWMHSTCKNHEIN